MHVMEIGPVGEITAETFRNAARLAAWYLDEGQRVLGSYHVPKSTVDAQELLAWMQRRSTDIIKHTTLTKSELSLLAPDEEDWRAVYEERAAIAEHDGGLDKKDAEQQAFDCTLVSWLNAHPEPVNNPDVCHYCGGQLTDTDMLPIFNGPATHVWLHPRCHKPFIDRRREIAIAALKTFGLMRG